MLKDIRRNFILVSMAAFSLVMITLAIVINLWNYRETNRRLDTTLSEILAFEEKQMDTDEMAVPRFPEEDRELRMEHPEFPTSVDPEAEASTRFFTVILDENESRETIVHRDYIKSIGEEECIAYAGQVLESGRIKGYRKNWRYLRVERQGKEYIVFLNAALDLHAMKVLALISLLTLLVSLLLVLLLIVAFSGRAIKPFADNVERQRRFITDASHELKTPLTSISTSADVLAMEIQDNEWVENIRSQSEHMTKLVKNMVLLAGLDEDVSLTRMEDFDLGDMVWEGVEAFRFPARARNCDFSISVGEAPPSMAVISEGKYSCDIHDLSDGGDEIPYKEVPYKEIPYRGDPVLIQKLFSLLLDNAVRYCDEGGCINIQVSQKGKRMLLSIGNPCMGHGITEPERLFDRFYRPDDSRSSHTGNYGIGLSTAKAIVEKHGGTIHAVCPDKDHIEFQMTL